MININHIYTIIHVFLLFSFRLSYCITNVPVLLSQTEKVKLSMMYHLLYRDGIIKNPNNKAYMIAFLGEFWHVCYEKSADINQEFLLEFFKIYRFVSVAMEYSEEKYKSCLVDLVINDCDLEYLSNHLELLEENSIHQCPCINSEYNFPFTSRSKEEIYEDWNMFRADSILDQILSNSIQILD